MTPAPAVLVMAKAPVAGRAKTRLEPLLGPDGCARLQRELIAAAVEFARRVAPEATYVAADGDLDAAGAHVIAQRGGDLGERLRAAIAEVFERRAGDGGPVIVVGTDCPQLGAEHAVTALAELARRGGAAPVPIGEIARARDIPVQFLEGLFATLRRAGILQSQRGVKGGYLFGREPSDVTVLEVVELLEGELGVDGSSSSPVWTEAVEAVKSVLGGTTIADVAEREAQEAGAPMYYI
jgi:Rrf2 family protein